jgi:hypothetical protein
MTTRISVECADVIAFPCDVLILKYAQNFYGADELVADRLGKSTDIHPSPWNYFLTPSNAAVAAKEVLFVGVPELYQFEYSEIRSFASHSLSILSEQMPGVAHVAMTVHGVGYGLDEKEAFLAQIAGVLDAFQAGRVPPVLRTLSIVERNPGRSERLKVLLEASVPSRSLGVKTLSPRGVEGAPEILAGKRATEKPHIFVAMPFNDDMEDTYIFGIQGPVNAAGFLCERVDMTVFTGDILARIKSRIETAALVIADLTGANPNVYLEVGYAWGKGRDTLLISRGSEELKFDVRGQRTLVYKSISDLAKKLEADLAAIK